LGQRGRFREQHGSENDERAATTPQQNFESQKCRHILIPYAQTAGYPGMLRKRKPGLSQLARHFARETLLIIV
jgi:hypothetical protein